MLLYQIESESRALLTRLSFRSLNVLITDQERVRNNFSKTGK